MRNTEDGSTLKLAEFDIISGLTSGEIQIQNDKSVSIQRGNRTESAVAVQDMMHRKMWIENLKNAGIERIVDEPWVRSAINKLAQGALQDIKRYSISTLQGTARKLRAADNDWTQVIPKYSKRGGAGGTRLESEVESIIKTQIDSIKADPKLRIVKKQIVQDIQTQILDLNIGKRENPLEMPSASTIIRRIDRHIEAYDIHIRNRGKESAAKEYRINSYPRNNSQYPLLVSEYDDTDSGVFLIDERSGLPFGRGYITHGVCQNTKLPLGFSLGHEARSYTSAIRAITSSLLPKEQTSPDYINCVNPWIGYGVQGEILMDNATYNKSYSLGQASDNLNALFSLTRPFGPTEKRDIEAFNAIVKSDLCPTLPGYRGEKDDPDAVKNGMASAALTVQQLRRYYTKWVTDIYQNKPGDDGYTPRERWEKHFKSHSPSIRWSAEQLALFTLRWERNTYKFRDSGGILRLGLTYDSAEFEVLRSKLGSIGSVHLAYNTDDLSYIYVKNPYSKDLLKVPCVDTSVYASGLSNYQQKLILKICRERGNKNPNIREMVAGRKVLARLVAQDAKSNKLRTRQKAYRVGDPGHVDEPTEEAATTSPPQPPQTIVMTALEYSIQQLELIDISDLEESWT